MSEDDCETCNAPAHLCVCTDEDGYEDCADCGRLLRFCICDEIRKAAEDR